MGRWTRVIILAAALIGLAGTTDAATRGGKLTYARYADSLLLDPVFNDANVDIWILTNLYDTLLQPTADGKGVVPGLATGYKLADDGLQRMLICPEPLQPFVEQNTVADGEHQQHRHQALDCQTE